MDETQLKALQIKTTADAATAGTLKALANDDYPAAVAQIAKLKKQVADLQVPSVAPTPTPTPSATAMRFGAYTPDLPEAQAELVDLEKQLGRTMAVASSFTDWSYTFGNSKDQAMSANGTREVLYSWEPFGIRFAQITAGSQDAYLQRIADSMVRYPRDIYVRPWGEMNANWSSWQPTADGAKRDAGTPAEFIAAWRYVVKFFRDRSVKNLKFVFNPDSADHPSNTRVPSIWPGADHVDVLGIDGYNWGINPATGDTWREFDTIFAGMYDILTKLHPTAPVWICETGCKEPTISDGAPVDSNHSKADWLTNMMAMVGTGKFPRIKAIAWFNVRKERDWRLQSHPACMQVMTKSLRAGEGSGPVGAPYGGSGPDTDTSDCPDGYVGSEFTGTEHMARGRLLAGDVAETVPNLTWI